MQQFSSQKGQHGSQEMCRTNLYLLRPASCLGSCPQTWKQAIPLLTITLYRCDLNTVLQRLRLTLFHRWFQTGITNSSHALHMGITCNTCNLRLYLKSLSWNDKEDHVAGPHLINSSKKTPASKRNCTFICNFELTVCSQVLFNNPYWGGKKNHTTAW